MVVLRTTRGPAKIRLNLTAMIDVIFLLLVYFMCNTDFKRSEECYRFDLPPRGQQADPFELPREPLIISITSAGTSYTIRIFDEPLETFEDLFAFLDEKRIRAPTGGGLYEADYPIIIEPARTTRWEHTMDAFNAAARARYTNITFAPTKLRRAIALP